jgi:hypothetical protein
VVDIESQVRKGAHVEIRHANDCEEGNKVSAPIGIQQLEARDYKRDYKKNRGDIVTEEYSQVKR